jgi:hypothetical protein
MALSDPEKTDARRYCGYPAHGAGAAGFQNWRFYQIYGLLEFRLNNLSAAEEAVVRRYLAAITNMELAVPRSAENLDTDQAAVWTHNKTEAQDRTRLLDDWSRRLCGFLGVPPGPALGRSSVTLTV